MNRCESAREPSRILANWCESVRVSAGLGANFRESTRMCVYFRESANVRLFIGNPGESWGIQENLGESWGIQVNPSANRCESIRESIANPSRIGANRCELSRIRRECAYGYSLHSHGNGLDARCMSINYNANELKSNPGLPLARLAHREPPPGPRTEGLYRLCRPRW